VLATFVLCIVAGAALRYTIPAFVASIVLSAALAANRPPPAEHILAFYGNVFLGTFFFIGTVFGLLAMLIWTLRSHEP
jgi:hypothetical protein